MRTQLPFALLATAVACSFATAPAHARARVFVASYGNDANPCTFGSPCKTFQQAVNVVDAGGEVTAIDSAGFGPINISKAVTITSPDGVEAGIVPAVSGGNSITINAGPGDDVSLSGLTMDGGGTGNGILFDSGKSLTVENSRMRHFTHGILFQPNASSSLTVSNSLLSANYDGIIAIPTGSGSFTIVINRGEAINNINNGIEVDGNNCTGTVNVTVSDSVVSGNTDAGIFGGTDSSHAPTTIMVFRSVIANNSTGLFSSGVGATLFLAYSTVTGNAGGWAAGPGVLQSYGNNSINGNGASENAPPSVGLK